MRHAVMLLCCLGLVSCVSPQERQARQINNARATCRSAGFKEGTTELDQLHDVGHPASTGL